MTRASKSELSAWAVLALAGGCVTGWIDLSAPAVQSTALILMVVTFALTLPGRAPAPLIAVCTSLGIPLVHAVAQHDVNPGFVIVLIPAFIAAYGGQLAGKLLETATTGLTELSPRDVTAPWYDQPLSTRVVLALALVIIAAAGTPSVAATLVAIGHRAPQWVAFVWQIMTLLGWIGVTPLVLARRRRVAARSDSNTLGGVRLLDVVGHLATVGVLSAVHVGILLVLSAALFIPVTPGWYELWSAALGSYLPLDVLAYLAILALAAASDIERHRRDAMQRETSLRAAALDSRLTALRARLNPHFLFNALNSIHVLARAGKTEEASRVIEGVTELLRYVLDDRRADVPLGEEIAFVRRYFEIQQVRFGTRLRYEIHYDDTLNASVPQLMLQPIVENAVEHGVAASLDGGTVCVSATVNEGVVRVIVDDDGPAPAGDGPSLEGGIGLTSTRERLATLYGDRAGLIIGPRTGARGTRVEIEIRPAP